MKIIVHYCNSKFLDAGVYHGLSTSSRCTKCGVTSGFGVCDCRVLGMVDEAFRGEFEILKENLELVEPPLSGILPNLCLLKINFV